MSLFSDRGLEYTNSLFRDYCDVNNIQQFFASPPIKCSLCERVIRTIFQIISKYMTHFNTKRFIQYLSSFEYIYNHSYHRSIKTFPANVNRENWQEVWDAQYSKRIPKSDPIYVVGDSVLRKKDKPLFTKGYTQSFEKKPYTIYKVKETQPPTYFIENDEGRLRRPFYKQELLPYIEEESNPIPTNNKPKRVGKRQDRRRKRTRRL